MVLHNLRLEHAKELTDSNMKIRVDTNAIARITECFCCIKYAYSIQDCIESYWLDLQISEINQDDRARL